MAVAACARVARLWMCWRRVIADIVYYSSHESDDGGIGYGGSAGSGAGSARGAERNGRGDGACPFERQGYRGSEEILDGVLRSGPSQEERTAGRKSARDAHPVSAAGGDGPMRGDRARPLRLQSAQHRGGAEAFPRGRNSGRERV